MFPAPAWSSPNTVQQMNLVKPPPRRRCPPCSVGSEGGVTRRRAQTRLWFRLDKGVFGRPSGSKTIPRRKQKPDQPDEKQPTLKDKFQRRPNTLLSSFVKAQTNQKQSTSSQKKTYENARSNK